MFCDSHIHFGQYYNYYVSPQDIVGFMRSVGVTRFAASSTTTCTGQCDKVLDEMKEITDYGKDIVSPVLWISPEMLSTNIISKFLTHNIAWSCIKIHGFFHNWHTDLGLLNEVINIARTHSLPILLHTGGNESCEAISYKTYIVEHNDVNFILAHARPIDQCFEVLKECSNAYVDSAFVPNEHICQLVNSGYEDRVLFGTDYIIPRVYHKRYCNLIDFYIQILSSLQQHLSPQSWEKITHLNYSKIFT